jgi:hypothetical protein
MESMMMLIQIMMMIMAMMRMMIVAMMMTLCRQCGIVRSSWGRQIDRS